jgi:hypothetical protein
MKPRKTIIFIFIGVLAHSGGSGVMAASMENTAHLAKALADHCVPKCTSGCSNTFIAEYKDGNCICPANLTYDDGLRECVVKCPAGMYALKSNGECPAGTQAHNGAGCPAGMQAAGGTNCPAGAYKLGVVDEHGAMAEGTVCPVGNYTIKIN